MVPEIPLCRSSSRTRERAKRARMAHAYGCTIRAGVTDRRDPLLGTSVSRLQRGFGCHRFDLLWDRLPGFKRTSICRFDFICLSFGSPGKRRVLCGISHRSICTVIRISRYVAKEKMGSVCNRIVVCKGFNAILGSRYVRIVVQVKHPNRKGAGSQRREMLQ